MNFLLTALLLGVVSMIIVFVAGFSSGVVRLSTLAFRAIFAFSMTGAAVYFLLMLFDYYEEMQTKKLKKDIEEIVPEENSDTEADAEQPPQAEEVFKPIDETNLPNVGK